MNNQGAEAIKKLDDSQVEAFDTEYVEGGRWDAVKAYIDRDFPDGEFTFLDVGGGNGKFGDRLLLQYPRSKGTILDNSEVLLAKNLSHERKTVICDSVENLGRINAKFDVICVHWLLHHLVSDSYVLTRQNQLATLTMLTNLMTPRGRVSVFENMYNGWLIDGLPGWLIYHLTSAKAIAAITRRMGANTSGVGACFLSKKQWLTTIHDSRMHLRNYMEPDKWVWPLKPEWRLFLHLGQIRVGHFWLNGEMSPSLLNVTTEKRRLPGQA